MSSAPSVVNHQRVIAIDGPAAAGKSTVARILADRLGALLFDTGALYRAIALVALRSAIDPEDTASLARLARDTEIRVCPPSQLDGRLYDVWLGREDVTWAIRAPEVGAIVSEVAEQPALRAALLPVQRRIAAQDAVVMVGRDIGTVVVPDAGLKVYLDASPGERARRRFREMASRGGDASFQEVLLETRHRDELDSTRPTAPLRVAPDAVRIDTENLEVADVVAAIERLARTQRAADGELLWPA
jgi:cytidylate kinase